jgi:acetyl-CoA carboxylase carboxyl transferase subunit alpha
MPGLHVSKRLELLHSMGRLSINDLIPFLFEDFMELHGDRCFGDDPAILGGIGILRDPAGLEGIDRKTPVTIIAQVRGRNIEELKAANFSMPHPEGYRKALRLAKGAEKFGRPVICFIDTPGAFCGLGAEERGQAEAIARCLLEFMYIQTPVISVVLGEGGSGGALAIGVCDELAMLENALYSVISPRSFASIVWKDAAREKEAADLMKIRAEDLLNFGICDYIIPEPPDGNIPLMAANIFAYLSEALNRLAGEDVKTLPEKRYDKFRRIGVFREDAAGPS